MRSHFNVDEIEMGLRAHLIVSTATREVKVDRKNTASKKAPRSAKSETQTNKKESKYDRWTLKDNSTIDYGFLKSTGGAGIKEASEGYYITTAINYTNGPAHMGHAYEAATSDVIARFERLRGDQPAYFVNADEISSVPQ